MSIKSDVMESKLDYSIGQNNNGVSSINVSETSKDFSIKDNESSDVEEYDLSSNVDSDDNSNHLLNGINEFISDPFKVWKSGFDSFKSNWNSGIDTIGKEFSKTDLFQTMYNNDLVKPTVQTLSTAGNIMTSVGTGIFKVGEGIVDLLTITGGGIATIGTGIVDAVAYATGNDLGLTNKLWNDWIKPGVEYEIVDNISDYYYSDYGKEMNENAQLWTKKGEIGYQGGEMVGRILATLAGGKIVSGAAGSVLSGGGAASGGVASKIRSFVVNNGMSIFAGLTGAGEGTHNAWNDGASTTGGLLYGGASGAWEGLQWYIGGKVNQFTPFKDGNLLSTIGNIGVRGLLDGVDNAAEVPVRSLFQSIYNGKSWEENFEAAGGMKETIVQGLIGFGLSVGGETINALAEGKKKNNSVSNIQSKNDNNININEANKTDSSLLLKEMSLQESLKKYTPADMRSIREYSHSMYDSYFGFDTVEKVLKEINIIDDKDWINVCKKHGLNGSNIRGFVSSNHEVYIPTSASNHEVNHELLHRFSEIYNSTSQYTDAFGNSHKITGVRQYYSDGANSDFANEALTEFLDSKYSDGILYSSIYGTENVQLWSRIDDAIRKSSGFENDLLFNSYIYNNTNNIRSFFEKYSHLGSYDEFVKSFNVFGPTTEMNKIVAEIEKNVFKSNNSIFNIIDSIFGRKK